MKDRSHHDFILHKDFEVLENLFRDYKIDVMVEAKKKEKAVIKLLEEIHEAF
jgi:UV DNA damage endonuclease